MFFEAIRMIIFDNHAQTLLLTTTDAHVYVMFDQAVYMFPQTG